MGLDDLDLEHLFDQAVDFADATHDDGVPWENTNAEREVGKMGKPPPAEFPWEDYALSDTKLKTCSTSINTAEQEYFNWLSRQTGISKRSLIRNYLTAVVKLGMMHLSHGGDIKIATNAQKLINNNK